MTRVYSSFEIKIRFVEFLVFIRLLNSKLDLESFLSSKPQFTNSKIIYPEIYPRPHFLYCLYAHDICSAREQSRRADFSAEHTFGKFFVRLLQQQQNAKTNIFFTKKKLHKKIQINLCNITMPKYLTHQPKHAILYIVKGIQTAHFKTREVKYYEKIFNTIQCT